MNSMPSTQSLTPAAALVVRANALTYGSGLYAECAYRAGEVIARFDDAQPSKQSYLTVQVGPECHVALDVLGNLNHSCHPNTVIDTGTRTVSACRPISPGDMLTFFYPSTEWQMSRPFSCQCGAPECVGFVAGARYLPVDTLARYAINPHIVGMIAAALSGVRVTS